MNRILLLPVLLICGSILGGEKDYADYRYNYNSCSLSGQAITRSEIRNKAISGLQGRPDFIYENYDDHITWHNRDNTNLCIMKAPVEDNGYGEPAENWVDIFNQALFCEGHNERGMNVSWYNDQFVPYGERELTNGTNYPTQIYASSKDVFISDMKNNELHLSIEIDSTEFIKGQQFTYYIKIKNLTKNPIKIDGSDLSVNYFSVDQNKYFESYIGTEDISLQPEQLIILPVSKYWQFLDDSFNANIRFKGGFWPEGTYNITAEIKNYNLSIMSNTIKIDIKPVPFDALDSFKTLVTYHSKIKKIRNGSEAYKIIDSLYSNNIFKNTIYEKEFYRIAGANLRYEIDIEKDLKENINLELFKNYPNSAFAINYYKFIQTNKDEMKDIYMKLNNVLNNIPDEKKKRFLQISKEITNNTGE